METPMERIARVINPRAYLRVNIPALSVGIITYVIWVYFHVPEQLVCWQNILLVYCIGSITMYFYVTYLYYKFDKREKYFSELHAKMESERTLIGHILTCSMRTSFSAAIMNLANVFGTMYFFGLRDEFSFSWSDPTLTIPQISFKLLTKLILFVLEMFIWEIWFDFGHYWTHRMGHYFKWLYDFGHQYHHENVSPDAFDGFNITLDDAILTNFFPHMLGMFVSTKLVFSGFGLFPARPFSLFEYFILSSYKAFVEVTGHVGVDFKGHSFPLFPPLSYYTGIDIGTAAYHSLHHRYYTVNYSKRFTLWDRVFGTMKIPPVLHKKSKKSRLSSMRNVFKNKN